MRRILVISDDWEALQTYEQQLSDQFEVIAAPFGKIGLQIAREDSPDLILIDLYLPEMTAVDAVRKLRRDLVTKDIPVVVALDQHDQVLIDKDVFPLLKLDQCVIRPVNIERLKGLIK